MCSWNGARCGFTSAPRRRRFGRRSSRRGTCSQSTGHPRRGAVRCDGSRPAAIGFFPQPGGPTRGDGLEGIALGRNRCIGRHGDAWAGLGGTGRHTEGCDSRTNNTHEKLLECVTVEGARAPSGTAGDCRCERGHARLRLPGYDQSVEYAEAAFTAAGYDVTVQPFQFQTFVSLSPAILEQVAPPGGADREQHPVVLRLGRRDGGGVLTVRGNRVQRGRLGRVPGRQHRARPPRSRRLHVRREGDERLQRSVPSASSSTTTSPARSTGRWGTRSRSTSR